MLAGAWRKHVPGRGPEAGLCSASRSSEGASVHIRGAEKGPGFGVHLKRKHSPFRSWGRQGPPGRRKSQAEARCGPVNRSPLRWCRGWEGERWASAESRVQRGTLRARVQESDMMYGWQLSCLWGTVEPSAPGETGSPLPR